MNAPQLRGPVIILAGVLLQSSKRPLYARKLRLGGGAKQSPKAIVSDESKAKTNSLADVARESFAMLISVFAKRIYTLSGEAAFPVPHSRNGPRLLSENDISYSANNENLTLLANRYTWGISFPQVISRWLSRAQLRQTTIAG